MFFLLNKRKKKRKKIKIKKIKLKAEKNYTVQQSWEEGEGAGFCFKKQI